MTREAEKAYLSESTGNAFADMPSVEGVVFGYAGGECPFQSEGTVDGEPFYFRSRGEHWSMGIGGEPVGRPDWIMQRLYGPWPSAGYITAEEAYAFICEAVAAYRKEKI